MKILLPVKRVIDPYLAVRIDAAGRDIVREQQPHTLNPFDAAALARAAQWRADGTASELVAIAVGSAPSGDTLRTALAMGADRAIHVLADGPAPPSPFDLAAVLHRFIVAERPDLVLIGKQASDDDAHETPALLAALARLPLLPDVYAVAIEAGRAVASFDLNGTPVRAAAPLPCIIACDLHLAAPGPIGLAQMMQAKRKPLSVRPFETPEPPPSGEPRRIGLALPAARPPCRLLEGTDELVALLLAARDGT